MNLRMLLLPLVALLVTAGLSAEAAPNDPNQIVTFDRVQPLLKRCDACHTKAEEDDIPTFAKLPIGFSGKADEHASWITEMSERMNLPDGTRRKMPKKPNEWAQEEIDLIKTWLAQGARDVNGEPTVLVGDHP